jgi:sirohydrochlorin cobaltochelatase
MYRRQPSERRSSPDGRQNRTVTENDRAALEEIDFRLRILLPEEYQDTYDALKPAPMRAAGLKFDAEGRVAWNEIWGSFCDLAMAGGPPHKGALLGPGSLPEIAAAPTRYDEVVAEAIRGVHMVTGLLTEHAPSPGWIRVRCHSEEMAGWLLRAITMENVAVRTSGIAIDLPVGPRFRLEKEIKNIVTVIAKTCHYWLGHMPPAQHGAIADLFAALERRTPLLVPLDGWRGVPYGTARDAIWRTRALVAHNVLARREDLTVFVPLNRSADPGGARVARELATIDRLAGESAKLEVRSVK